LVAQQRQKLLRLASEAARAQ